MAEQVNVFVQNRPGRLEQLTRVLAEAGVNIRAITIAGAGDYGVVKLLADDPASAWQALAANGFSVASKRVIAAVMDDRPGGLAHILGLLAAAGINVEDAYGFVVKDRETAVLLLELEDVLAAEGALKEAGVRLLSHDELL
ncbi:MAG: ACT domain-containing protein [Candidatus Geothermincolia bacterium]